MALKIAFVNNKGGSTKTTSVVNLAGAINVMHPKARIAIVDNDGQGNASRSFGKNPRDYEDTMYDVFMGTKELKDVVQKDIYENIDILPANTDMNFFEFDKMKDYEEEFTVSTFQLIKGLAERGFDFTNLDLSTWREMIPDEISITQNYFNLLEGKFEQLDKEYDVIIFDTPPEIKSVTSSVIAVADTIVIPYEPEIYSVDGIVNILDRIKYIKEEYNPKLQIAGLLPVKVRANTNVHADTMLKVIGYANTIGIPFFSTSIPNTIKFSTSTASRGLPATLGRKVKSSEDLVHSYFNLLEEMENKGIINFDNI
ncbi:ParA family protein [Enterococcus sp. DIV0086]|uniref:ParA family protein n=1 Tax=Enterococcus sp. DIV0086 TaxID=2774655 RepID=UPI003D282182